jgi:hypothetical protein
MCFLNPIQHFSYCTNHETIRWLNFPIFIDLSK